MLKGIIINNIAILNLVINILRNVSRIFALSGSYMDLKKALVSVLAIFSSQITRAGENYIVVQVHNLDEHGISAQVVREEFYNRYQVNIDWNEYLKVSKEDEGKDIRFETYDRFSTIVSIARAHGVGNKGFK